MDADRNIIVGTSYDCCDGYPGTPDQYIFNPSMRHNMIGCSVISIFQAMFHMNVTYETKSSLDFDSNNTIDVFAVPMTTRTGILEIANPVDAVVLWRFGFILRRSHDLKLFKYYYTKPFTKRTWNCIAGMGVMVAILFFMVRWWEKRLLGGLQECSMTLEVLLTVGGYCQHIFPVDPRLCSRRTIYFTFFLYCYIMYTVYTSNLLSHLVNDKDRTMKLNELRNSDIGAVTYEGMKQILTIEYDLNIPKELANIKVVEIDDALEAVKTNQTAFLSDYTSIYPTLKRKFNDHEISELIEVDLNSDVRKFIFASKTFRYTEELRISILRAKEGGILARLISFKSHQLSGCLNCDLVLPHEVRLTHIISPLTMLFAVFGLSTLILILERAHFNRFRVWPYLE